MCFFLRNDRIYVTMTRAESLEGNVKFFLNVTLSHSVLALFFTPLVFHNRENIAHFDSWKRLSSLPLRHVRVRHVECSSVLIHRTVSVYTATDTFDIVFKNKKKIFAEEKKSVLKEKYNNN